MPAQYDWETSRDLPALSCRPAYNASHSIAWILDLFDKVSLFGGTRPPEGTRASGSAAPAGLCLFISREALFKRSRHCYAAS
jgi:hypothetical protein